MLVNILSYGRRHLGYTLKDRNEKKKGCQDTHLIRNTL